MWSIFLIAAMALASVKPCRSADIAGETHGPVTRYGVTALAVAPSSPQKLYAGSDMAGLFKSIDGGTSWSTIWPPTSGSSVTNHISDIGVDPHNADLIYVAVDSYVGSWQPGGVYKSIDGGMTWEPINEGLPGSAVSFLSIDPNISGVLYVGVSDQLYESVDYGTTWQSSLSGIDVSVLAIDVQNSRVLYAGGRGIFKSIDGGQSWASASQGLALDKIHISSMGIDPRHSNILYAGGTPLAGPDSPGRVFKSIDGGATWIETAQVGTWLRTLAIDPDRPETLYIGSSGKGGEIGTFQSVDGGTHWQRISRGGAHRLAIAPDNSQVVYAAMRTNAQGVYRFSLGDVTVIEEAGWGLIKMMFR